MGAATSKGNSMAKDYASVQMNSCSAPKSRKGAIREDGLRLGEGVHGGKDDRAPKARLGIHQWPASGAQALRVAPNRPP